MEQLLSLKIFLALLENNSDNLASDKEGIVCFTAAKLVSIEAIPDFAFSN